MCTLSFVKGDEFAKMRGVSLSAPAQGSVYMGINLLHLSGSGSLMPYLDTFLGEFLA